MTDLPTRLRQQAQALLTAARRGDQDATARIQAVSDELTLTSVRLTLAREHGFAGWAEFEREVDRRDILDSRDTARLTALLAAHPDLATSRLAGWPDHANERPLAYLTMLWFNHRRLGLPRELPGTGAVAAVLIAAGAPVDGHPGDKETPLITAASHGDADVAQVLIEAGAHLDAVSAPDSGGAPSHTALGHAAAYGMTEVLDVVVAAGARIASLEMAAAAGDLSAWPLARFTLQSRLRALVFAADHQRREVVDQLVAAGTPVNQADAEWHRLPLHVAAGNGRTAAVRQLLAHGADPNLRDPCHHRTPLEECRAGNRHLDSPEHEEVAAILEPLTRQGA